MLEAQCDPTYPACGCAAQQPFVDDGSHVQFQGTAGVTCLQGKCTTFVPECGQPCATGTTCFSCTSHGSPVRRRARRRARPAPTVTIPPSRSVRAARRATLTACTARHRPSRATPNERRQRPSSPIVLAGALPSLAARRSWMRGRRSAGEPAPRGTGGPPGGRTGVCAVACTTGRTCCGGTCVNLQNDPLNCGTCGRRCEGNTPYCGDGTCQQPPCDPQVELCAPNSICCGSTCCQPGDICCEDQGPISTSAELLHADGSRTDLPAGLRAAVQERPQSEEEHRARGHRRDPEEGQRASDLDVDLPGGAARVRHLGPMAQDFHASFGLGNDDRTYHSVDAHGVALAAIQALERVVKQQEQRIERLERENRALRKRLPGN